MRAARRPTGVNRARIGIVALLTRARSGGLLDAKFNGQRLAGEDANVLIRGNAVQLTAAGDDVHIRKPELSPVQKNADAISRIGRERKLLSMPVDNIVMMLRLAANAYAG